MLDKIFKILAIIVLCVYGLVAAQNVLIPLFVAIFLWFVIFEIATKIEQIKIGKSRSPRWLAYLLSMTVLAIVGYFLVNAMVENLKEITTLAPKYEINMRNLIVWIQTRFKVNVEELSMGWLKDFDLKSLAAEVLNQVYGLVSSGFMILLYIVFLIIESEFFTIKLKKAIPSKSNLLNAVAVINNIKESLGNYIFLKTGVSLITGICSYIILLLIGVDLAFFWAMLIFFLNYIPSIGSLIATVFPAMVALFQFGTLQPFLLVLVLIGALQVIIGNIVEPKVFGNKLNISGFVVIVSLAIWGAIWGVAGMVLSVPIALVSIAILDQFPQTKGIAVFLKS
jgi:AI-2 transport protein TqsA